jgi:hypothetical protein
MVILDVSWTDTSKQAVTYRMSSDIRGRWSWRYNVPRYLAVNLLKPYYLSSETRYLHLSRDILDTVMDSTLTVRERHQLEKLRNEEN